MSGYTPLFASIITSSIWDEDDKTRIVWITMLALADSTGLVEASIPSLAHIARVDRNSCEKALEKLSAPDTNSRSKEFQGRRIEKVDGGWLILNLVKYRQKAKQKTAEWWRKYRKRRATNLQPICNQMQPNATIQTQTQTQTDLKDTSYLLSKLLFDEIIRRKPDFKKPNLQVWAKHITRMVHLDKRTPERIEAVIRWCQTDPFWQNNILSTQKLRQQFDALELKMRGSYAKGKPKYNRDFANKRSNIGSDIEM